MFIRKRSTGSGLQVLLEIGRTLIIIKANRRYDMPRCVPGSVGGAAMIVSGQSPREAIRKSNVALPGVRDAL